MTLPQLASDPLLGVSTTVIAYALATALHRRFPLLHPLLLTCSALIALLLLAHIPYDRYKSGGDIISFFLGPATVALGVPLYKNFARIRRHALAAIASITAGSASGIASAYLLVKLSGGSDAILRSMLPKSVTTPISIELSRQLGGDPPLTAVFTVLAGLLGAVLGPRLLRLCRIKGDIPLGLAIGTSSHGIGTARLVRDNQLQAGTSALAMALAGIITSLLIIPTQRLLPSTPHPQTQQTILPTNGHE